MIKRVINDFLITNTREYTSPHILWETLKCVIRGETIKFCALRKKNQNRKQHLLESKLNTMELLLNNCPTKEKDNLILLKLNWAPLLFGFKRAHYHNCKQVYVTYNLFKNKDEKYNNLTMFKNS